jgi:hypothetical protein
MCSLTPRITKGSRGLGYPPGLIGARYSSLSLPLNGLAGRDKRELWLSSGQGVLIPLSGSQSLRGIDEQVTKAEQAVAGKAPVKRNPYEPSSALIF